MNRALKSRHVSILGGELTARRLCDGKSAKLLPAGMPSEHGLRECIDSAGEYLQYLPVQNRKMSRQHVLAGKGEK